MKISTKKYNIHKHLTVLNDGGLITACLYILPNGTIHADSWICHNGWGVDNAAGHPYHEGFHVGKSLAIVA